MQAIKASKIQVNKYIGLDNEKLTIITEEIKTLKLMEKLNKQKEQITAYNKEHNIINKGFSANFHNYKRTSDNYSIAEGLFRDILELKNIGFIHEHKIKVKDALLRLHTYHLDFYLPDIKLAVEISPLFHFTYPTVAIRDKLRESLLLRKYGIKTHVIKVHFRTKKGKTETYLNKADINKALKLIGDLKKIPNKETLTAYIKKPKKVKTK